MTITTTYTSFLLDTGPNWLSGPGKRINAVARLNYDIRGALARGKKMSRLIRGGSSIKDQILLSITPRAENIGILDSTTPNITESGTNIEAFWRIMRTHIAYDKRVRALNEGGTVGSEGGFQTYKNMRDNDMQEMYTDWENKCDDNLWAPANFTTMEGAAGKDPMSISALVNEFSATNGLTPASTGSVVWTSKYGVPSTTAGFSNYDNQRATYDNLNVASSTNLVAAFDRMFEALAFKPPPTNKQYFDPESGFLPAQTGVWCSKEGKVALKQLCRNSQDRWDSQTDAYGGVPTYNGVPFHTAAKLTTAAIFPTGTSGLYGTEVTAAGANNNSGYRFFCLDFNHLDLIYHDEYFFKASEPQSQYGNPSRVAIFYETFVQLFANSLRNHGFIYPSANVA